MSRTRRPAKTAPGIVQGSLFDLALAGGEVDTDQLAFCSTTGDDWVLAGSAAAAEVQSAESLMTPVEVDTRLAEISRARGPLEQNVTVALSVLHRLAGDKGRIVYHSRKRSSTVYDLTDDQAIARGRELAAENLEQEHYGTNVDARKYVAQLDTARAALDALDAEEERLDEEWESRRWSRFFIVSKGHIHSSRSCSTCNNGKFMTDFGWLPGLSGLDEAAAVAQEGPLLCTTCFPSAPVEWTVGPEKPARCAGGTALKVSRKYRTAYGTCPSCPEGADRQPVNNDGTVRAHKPQTAKTSK